MHRLPAESSLLERDSVALPAGAARHLRVLRPKRGERVELFDGRGGVREYVCGATPSDPLEAAGPRRFVPRPARAVSLFACVTKGSRWDWTVEKAVELGAARIVPVVSERCIVRLALEERETKAERWRRIAEDAARQSHAAWLPEIFPALDFPDALALARKTYCIAGAIADPPPPPMADAVAAIPPGTAECGFFVGPEGDFTPDELAALLEFAHPASLGPTILRAETAALFGLCVISGGRN